MPYRHPRTRGARCAEVASGTAADCAVVCCCCPCGLVALLVLAVVRMPAVLCRRAFLWCKHIKTHVAARRRRKCGEGAATGDVGAERVGVPGPRVRVAEEDGKVGFDFAVGVGGRGNDDHFGVGWWPAERSPTAEVSEMEKEMLARFYGGGFWRSASPRET